MQKIIKIFIIAAAAFFAAENTADAQLLKNLLDKASSSNTEQTSTATSEGKQAGIALKALYKQYKADGKLDMSNLNNLLNLTTLANNVKNLKGKSSKSTFYKDFMSGLIDGSDNLVNKTNSNEIMNSLSTFANVDTSALTQKATATKDKTSEVLDAVSDILSVLK